MKQRTHVAPDLRYSALFTDLYELTMGQAYHAEGLEDKAVFELFFRKMPTTRRYMVTAGLEQALEALENFCFSNEELEFLADLEMFSGDFLERLKHLRFTGDVFAIQEGTPVFPNEPLVQVIAPILEAQLVETTLLNRIHFQTVIASKAARLIRAAAGRPVVDFGSRRAHGSEAAMLVARVSYLLGAAGTSHVLSGKLYGIPLYGTMAHSYVQAHDCELSAFAAFAASFPEATLLVDTYDTIKGVEKVIELYKTLGEMFRIQAIRLDSGDLTELAKASRNLLDGAGLQELKIFASGELDEHGIQAMLKAGAPVDGFGVGTQLAIAPDAPNLDMAYKLVEYASRPRSKLSSRKLLYPGRKQVYRQANGKGFHDIITAFEEPQPGRALLEPVMLNGKRTEAGSSSLAELRRYALEQQEQLSEPLRRLDDNDLPPPWEISPTLKEKLRSLKERIRFGAEASS